MTTARPATTTPLVRRPGMVALLVLVLVAAAVAHTAAPLAAAAVLVALTATRLTLARRRGVRRAAPTGDASDVVPVVAP